MNISQAAAACGLPSKTVRYYESLGLVVPARQEGNEYRVYSLDDVDQLRFLQRARASGFDLEQCRELLALYINPKRRSAGVKALLLDKIQQVDQQLIALNAMRQTLAYMADDCSRSQPPIDTHKPSSPLSNVPMPFTLIDTVDD